MARDHESSAGDSLLRIEISPSLPCGIGDCGRPTHYARIEHDPRYDALWRLLPICEAHLLSLDAAGRAVADAATSAATDTTGETALTE
jgi:hypothetical protein